MKFKYLQHKHKSLMTKVNDARQKKEETSTVQTKMYDVHTKKVSKEKVI